MIVFVPCSRRFGHVRWIPATILVKGCDFHRRCHASGVPELGKGLERPFWPCGPDPWASEGLPTYKRRTGPWEGPWVPKILEPLTPWDRACCTHGGSHTKRISTERHVFGMGKLAVRMSCVSRFASRWFLLMVSHCCLFDLFAEGRCKLDLKLDLVLEASSNDLGRVWGGQDAPKTAHDGAKTGQVGATRSPPRTPTTPLSTRSTPRRSYRAKVVPVIRRAALEADPARFPVRARRFIQASTLTVHATSAPRHPPAPCAPPIPRLRPLHPPNTSFHLDLIQKNVPRDQRFPSYTNFRFAPTG